MDLKIDRIVPKLGRIYGSSLHASLAMETILVTLVSLEKGNSGLYGIWLVLVIRFITSVAVRSHLMLDRPNGPSLTRISCTTIPKLYMSPSFVPLQGIHCILSSSGARYTRPGKKRGGYSNRACLRKKTFFSTNNIFKFLLGLDFWHRILLLHTYVIIEFIKDFSQRI